MGAGAPPKVRVSGLQTWATRVENGKYHDTGVRNRGENWGTGKTFCGKHPIVLHTECYNTHLLFLGGVPSILLPTNIIGLLNPDGVIVYVPRAFPDYHVVVLRLK